MLGLQQKLFTEEPIYGIKSAEELLPHVRILFKKHKVVARLEIYRAACENFLGIWLPHLGNQAKYNYDKYAEQVFQLMKQKFPDTLLFQEYCNWGSNGKFWTFWPDWDYDDEILVCIKGRYTSAPNPNKKRL